MQNREKTHDKKVKLTIVPSAGCQRVHGGAHERKYGALKFTAVALAVSRTVLIRKFPKCWQRRSVWDARYAPQTCPETVASQCAFWK